MERTNEDIKLWANIVQNAELEKDIEDAEGQTVISTGRQELDEMPMVHDIYDGDREDADATLGFQTDGLDSSKLVPVADHGAFKTFRNPRGDAYLAYDQNGKCIGLLRGSKSGTILQVDNTISYSQSGVKGVMFNLFMDCISQGNKIISDVTQSPDAKNFWQRLISTGHIVYVVVYGEVKGKATPQNMEKLWTNDIENDAADIRLLLVK